MGIMSDRTKSANDMVIAGLVMGLKLSGNPICIAAAAVIEAQGKELLAAGYTHLGWTDEVTVNAEGPIEVNIEPGSFGPPK